MLVCFRFSFLLTLILGFALLDGAEPPRGGTIRGKVALERNGAPVSNARVLLLKAGRTANTNESGEFEFRDVPEGQWELLAHMHPLADERKSVEVSSGKEASIDFLLRLAPLHEELTVSASGRESTALETFQSVLSKEGLELAQRPSTSLGESLEHETGVAKRSLGPGSSRPVIRGFDGDRVLVMQNGMPTGTLSSQSGDHGEPFDVTNLERVEILRGPATLLYGTNAIGGVVNVITDEDQLRQTPPSGVRGFLSGTGGSANALGGGSGGFTFGAGKWQFGGRGGGLRTGDYHTPAGKVENSETEIRHVQGSVGRFTDKTFVNVTYGVYDGRYGIPLAPHDDHDEDKAKATLFGRRFGARALRPEVRRGGGHDHDEGPVDLDWRRHNVRFSGGFRNLNSWVEGFTLQLNYSDWNHNEIAGGKVETQFYNKAFTYRGVFDQQKRGPWSGSFGFFGLRRDYEVLGDEALTPPVIQNAFAAFAVQAFDFERVRFQFGGRVENNRYDVERTPERALRNRSFTGLSASAATNLRLWDGGAFVASYNHSYRAPALEELYNFGPHPGNLAFEIGDDDLRPERSNGLELALRHQSRRVRGELSFFNYWIDNFVFLAPTGEIEDGLLEAFFRQGNSRYTGVEGRLDTPVLPRVWLKLGFDSVFAELTRGANKALPRIPPVRGRTGLDFRFGGFSVQPELILAARQNRVYTFESETAGYAVLNLGASYTLAQANALHSFGFQWFNAADRLYRNHVSLIKDFAPEIGRGVRFNYTVRFF
jgi:iron complex outermembrane receptor protein